jgi:hypothetical protein
MAPQPRVRLSARYLGPEVPASGAAGTGLELKALALGNLLGS